MSNKTVLAEGIYLFSTQFDGEKNERLGQYVYQDWHLNPKIINLGNNRLKNGVDNIRPVPFTPLIANIKELSERVKKEETNGIWGTDKYGLIHALEVGVQAITESGDFEYLQHKSVVNDLDDGQYSLCFPPLAILSRLTLDNKSPIEVAKKLLSYSSIIKKEEKETKEEKEVKFALTEIGLEQLAKPYEPSFDGTLTDVQKEYNQWYEEVSKQGESLKGFLLPSQAICSVVFSSKVYINARVSVLKFKQDKNSVKWEAIANDIPVTFPDNGSDDFPSALINVDPESFQEGYYSIRVTFDPRDFDNQIIPEYIQNSNIEKIKCGLLDGYQYELREYIRFDNHTPLGKMAIVCGDMISLEESLICQFPQYLSHLTAHLKGKETDTKALQSPALTSLAVLTGTKKASMILGMDLLAGGLTPQLNNGPTAMINNIAKLYWAEIKNKNLPTAMQATGEIIFGLQSINEGIGKLNNLMQLQEGSVAYRAELGGTALFKATVFDNEKYNKFKEYLAKANQEFKDGKYKVVVGRLSKSWFEGANLAGRGLVITDTAKNISSLFNHAKQITEQKKKAEKARGDMVKVASEYLTHIPVWTETQLALNKENQQAFELINIKNKTLFNDENGSGFNVVFEFDNKSTDTSQVRQKIADIVTFIEKQPSVQIIIEGHTCQVGTHKYNMELSQQRAQSIADLFPEKLQNKIDIIPFGETQPLITASGREITSNNPKLKPNRRVKIKTYLKVLDIVYSPSRSGMGVLERSRLITLNAMKKEDDLTLAAQLALLESLIGVACFIPLIGPAARGMLLAKDGSKIVQSGLSFLDEMIFEYSYEKVKQVNGNKKDLSNLAKIQMELLRELRKFDTKLEKKVTSYGDLTAYLSDDTTKNEILKRYQLRALAFNGLMMVLLYAYDESETSYSGKSFNQTLEKYDVKGYIVKYLQNDTWAVNSINNNDLGFDWINQCKQRITQDIQPYYQVLPIARPMTSYIQGQKYQEKGKVEGRFNRAFPVQGLLYELPSDNKEAKTLFEEFARNFSPLPVTLNLDKIIFQRILVSDQEGKNWVEYSKWYKNENSYITNRLSPFHRLKIQVVLDKSVKTVFPYEIAYQRVDGINIAGPKFNVLFKPMKYDDFSYKDAKLQKAIGNHDAVTAIEFEPFYYFGSQRIYGLKPIVSKDRVNALYFLHWLGIEKILAVKETAYEEYVSTGGFKNMRYQLLLKKPKSKHQQALMMNKSADVFKFGVHSENSHTVILENEKTGSTKTLPFISEGRLLEVEEFTYSTETGKRLPINVIDKVLYQSIGAEYKNTCYLAKQKNATETIKDFSWDKADELDALHILLCGKSNKKEYETALKEDWKSVDVMVQLQATKYVPEEDKVTNHYHHKTNINSSSLYDKNPSANISIKTVGGPIYKSTLKYVGEIRFDGIWKISIPDSTVITSKVSVFLTKSIEELNRRRISLDKKKSHAIHIASFKLKYGTPVGIQASGLRPFGDIIKGNDSLFNLQAVKFKQLNTENHVFLNQKSSSNFAMPTLNNTKLIEPIMPWMEPGAKGKNGVNGDVASEWGVLSDDKQRKERIKKWIKKEPSVIELKAKRFI